MLIPAVLFKTLIAWLLSYQANTPTASAAQAIM